MQSTPARSISRRKRPEKIRPSNYELTFMIIISVFALLSVALNFLHHDVVTNIENTMPNQHPMLTRERNFQYSKKMLREVSTNPNIQSNQYLSNNTMVSLDSYSSRNEKNDERTTSDEHSLGGLKCESYGGPDDEIAAKEMVYWSDITSDSKYVSPFKKNNDAKGGATQYMTFEPGRSSDDVLFIMSPLCV
jgi:hypothetical protein